MTYSCTDAELAAIKQLLGRDAASADGVCSSFNVTSLGVTNAVLSWTLVRLQNVNQELDSTKQGLDTSFLLQSAYTIFMMQAGFALFAAGVIRSKNTFNILMKNFVDACVAGITFYLVGYAFAFGTGSSEGEAVSSNGFIGGWDFALSHTMKSDKGAWGAFMFQWSFCAAAATIMSGAVAERVTFVAYLLYTAAFSTWVYPVVVHWVWSPAGWISAFNTNPFLGVGAVDFAGSGVVHLLAGCASLVGAYTVGPRIGRFDSGIDPQEFRGRSASTFVLGTFLLWFGWYGFNPGSNQVISNHVAAEIVGRIAVTTTLSGCMGAVTSALLCWYHSRNWDLLGTCCGLLSGLVAVTGGCSVLPTWAAILVGACSSVVYFYAERMMEVVKIDDPVGAFPMHGCCGLLGLFMIGLLADEDYMHQVYRTTKGDGYMGLFMGGNGKMLAAQIILIICITCWSLFWSAMIFFPLKKFSILRIDTIEEVVGLDVLSHGEALGVNMFNPNATKFPNNAPHHHPFDPNTGYPLSPEYEESPVTIRMDSRGNMRWTPRVPNGAPPPGFSLPPTFGNTTSPTTLVESPDTFDLPQPPSQAMHRTPFSVSDTYTSPGSRATELTAQSSGRTRFSSQQ